MKRIIRLTESDLSRIIRFVIKEEYENDGYTPFSLLSAAKDRKIYGDYVNSVASSSKYGGSVLWGWEYVAAEESWRLEYQVRKIGLNKGMVVFDINASENYKKEMEQIFKLCKSKNFDTGVVTEDYNFSKLHKYRLFASMNFEYEEFGQYDEKYPINQPQNAYDVGNISKELIDESMEIIK
jgi:hypothetical protein